MLKIAYLRWTSLIEGATLLVLLFIAMPLKYWFDIPIAVTIVGTIHGYAFVAFLFIVIIYFVGKRLQILTALRLIIGSTIPFGGFLNDKWLKSKEVEGNATNSFSKW